MVTEVVMTVWIRKTTYQDGMVNGVESCGEIEKTQTGYFLRANSINQMIMYIEESSFSGMTFAVSRLIWIEKVI